MSLNNDSMIAGVTVLFVDEASAADCEKAERWVDEIRRWVNEMTRGPIYEIEPWPYE